MGELRKDLLLCQSQQPEDLILLDKDYQVIKRVKNLRLYPNIYSNQDCAYFRGRKKLKSWYKLSFDNLEISELAGDLNSRAVIVDETAIYWKGTVLESVKLVQDGIAPLWQLDVYKLLSLEKGQSNEFEIIPLSRNIILLIARYLKITIRIKVDNGEILNVIDNVSFLNLVNDGEEVYFFDYQDGNLKVLEPQNKGLKSLDFPSIGLLNLKEAEKISIRISENLVAIPTLFGRMHFFDRKTCSKVHELDLETPPTKYLKLPLHYKIFENTAIIRFGTTISAPLKVIQIR
ncbi:MAG: hypothetical protein R2828_32985 [Saprospiraceae bacterium]